MTHVKRREAATRKLAATKSRTFRSFLLVAQLEAGEIGDRIRRARVEAGLTQEALAEMASFSKRSLQDYEGGVTIPYRHFRELAGLLNKEPAWFLYGDGEEEVGEPDAEVVARLDRIEQVLAELNARFDRADEEPPPG